MAQKLARYPYSEFHHGPGKPPLVEGGQREEHLTRLIEPRPRSRWSGNHERPLASGEKLSIEQQEGEPAEMVTMQVREQDAVDLVRIDVARLERTQGSRPKIDNQYPFRCFEEEAGIESPSRTEGIPRSEDGKTHESG